MNAGTDKCWETYEIKDHNSLIYLFIEYSQINKDI